jgi:hypothetical protein
MEPQDPEAAAGFTRLASECAHLLIVRDQRALRRKIDPAAVVALLFLTVPAIVVFVLTFTWTTSWRWPVMVFCAVWTLVWGGVGLTQLWAERSDETEPTEQSSPSAMPDSAS